MLCIFDNLPLRLEHLEQLGLQLDWMAKHTKVCRLHHKLVLVWTAEDIMHVAFCSSLVLFCCKYIYINIGHISSVITGMQWPSWGFCQGGFVQGTILRGLWSTSGLKQLQKRTQATNVIPEITSTHAICTLCPQCLSYKHKTYFFWVRDFAWMVLSQID